MTTADIASESTMSCIIQKCDSEPCPIVDATRHALSTCQFFAESARKLDDLLAINSSSSAGQKYVL